MQVLTVMSSRAVPCCAKPCRDMLSHDMPRRATPAGDTLTSPRPAARLSAGSRPGGDAHSQKPGIVGRKRGGCAGKPRRGARTTACSAHCGDQWITPRLAGIGLLDYV